MAKDVNIHIKTTGAQQARSDMNQVAQATEEMGAKTSRAAGWLKEAFTAFVGPLGFTAVAALAVAAIKKVIASLDDMKRASAEAVHELARQQQAANSFFEAMDAYSGPQRRAALTMARNLQAETGLPYDAAIQLLDAYKRTYGAVDQPAVGQLAGYWQLHGGQSTANLVRWFGAAGVKGTDRQGQILRLISAVTQQTGLRDEEIIENMLRYSTEFSQMGWSPEQAIQNVGMVMSGLAPREARRAMGGLVEGLKTLTEEKTLELKAPAAVASNEQFRIEWARRKMAAMTSDQQRKFAQSAFGQTYAAYVTKFFRAAVSPEMQQALEYAATPQAAAEEAARVAAYKETAEGMLERAKGGAGLFGFDVGQNALIRASIREYGRSYLEYLRRENRPMYEKIKFPNIGEEAEAEAAAEALWQTRQQEIVEPGFSVPGGYVPPRIYKPRWSNLPLDERLSGVEGAGRELHIHYHNDVNYNPVAGNASDREIGPRNDRDFR